MKKRPISVSIVAWIIIVWGAFALIAMPLAYTAKKVIPKVLETQLNNPKLDQQAKTRIETQIKTVEAQLNSPMYSKILVAGGIIALLSIISGIGILKGKNGARVLYVIVAVLGVLMAFSPLLAHSPHAMITVIMSVIMKLCIYGIILIFLFLPKANRYFSGSELTTSQPPPL